MVGHNVTGQLKKGKYSASIWEYFDLVSVIQVTRKKLYALSASRKFRLKREKL